MKIREFSKAYESFFPVGEGWKPLVTNLVNDIMEIDEKIEVTQVKEKFGGLRFYINKGSKDVYDLISRAERESLEICELCGSKEDVKQYGSWIKTHCKQCRELKESE